MEPIAAHAATEETSDLIQSTGFYVMENDRVATLDNVTESMAYGCDHFGNRRRWFLDGRSAEHNAAPSTAIVRGPISEEAAKAIEAVATSPVEPQFRSNRKPLVYLASPYSHASGDVRRQRFEKVSRLAAKILLDGRLLPFSPIAHSHPIAIHGTPDLSQIFATNWNNWQELDLAFIDRCDALIVVQLDGWEQSVDVTAEIDYAHSKAMPVVFYRPDQSLDAMVVPVQHAIRARRFAS